MKIAVGLSGGVDSAVAAYLLKKQGHDVVGVFMKIWDPTIAPNAEIPMHDACFGPGEKHDQENIGKITRHLGITFSVIDCVKEFSSEILSYFKQSYKNGLTPNPCVFCNQKLKFGMMPLLLTRQGTTFDAFATGHYARIAFDAQGKVQLKRAVHLAKDQTYFLHRLVPDQLKNAVFPLGELTKDQVRTIARDAGLHVWDKAESQDFYAGDYRDLLADNSHSTLKKSNEGIIVNRAGKILAKHSGIENFTIGQRKGLGFCSEKPMYVVEIRAAQNEVVVDEEQGLLCKGCVATDFNLLYKPFSDNLVCKIRSSQADVACSYQEKENNMIEVTFNQSVKGVCPGQSVVIYNEDVVVGGGIIRNSF